MKNHEQEINPMKRRAFLLFAPLFAMCGRWLHAKPLMPTRAPDDGPLFDLRKCSMKISVFKDRLFIDMTAIDGVRYSLNYSHVICDFQEVSQHREITLSSDVATIWGTEAIARAISEEYPRGPTRLCMFVPRNADVKKLG